MAQLLDHIEYLSKEIGPRPAGTEEEQEAALYIADKLQQEAGFHAEIEEFTSSSNLEGARAIPSVVIILVCILAMIFNAFTIPALILTLLVTAVYVLEAFDHNIVSKFLARGASQNVVAKYQPNSTNASSGRRGRSRKVVIVAHYDTGKVKPALLKRVESMGLPIGLICIAGMGVSAILLLIRIFVGGIGGPATIILNVFTILALLIVALPIVKAVLYRIAPYNEGANNNASGSAALIEIARRISEGSVSEAEIDVSESVVIHGREAALESGLVPDGVSITYETDEQLPSEAAGSMVENVEDEHYDEVDEKERLLAAKAAIAALTGRPVDTHIYAEPTSPAPYVDEPMVSYDEQVVVDQANDYSDPVQSSALDAAAVASENEAPYQAAQAVQASTDVAGFQNAPSWFVAAQQNAKKTTTEISDDQKSRYNQAIETAEREMAQREQNRIVEQRQQALAANDAMQNGSFDTAVATPESTPEPLEQMPIEQPAVVEDVKSELLADDATKMELPTIEKTEISDEPGQMQEEAEQPEVDLGQTIAWEPIKLNPEDLAEISDEPKQNEMAQENLDLPQVLDLPPIDPDSAAIQPAEVQETTSPSHSGLMRKLRADIPSLSGVISDSGVEAQVAKPINNAQVQSIDLPEISSDAPVKQVDVDYDMDLSSIDKLADIDLGVNVQGAHVARHAAGQVELPSSRADGFLGRIKGKNDSMSETPQEWLNVDEDFDARTVGRERGGWESFREDADQNKKSSKSSRNWEGGAFSRVRLGHVDTRSGVEETESEENQEAAAVVEETSQDQALNEEIGQIVHFRNPAYNTEVWFVAIGSDTELHDGAKAFVNEHADELRGSMIIEIESLGAGVLSYASEEGQFRKTAASSRIKRYVRPASEATGIALDTVKLNGADSVTTTVQKAGYQAMHLLGVENGSPALKGSADDVFENVDELILEDNIAFLMELLKHN